MVVKYCVTLLLLLNWTVADSYNYKEALRQSLLFYEAQRSGKLPADQKVAWRKDSALDDHGVNGEDLAGGYYDAGDYMKYGFPMAYTTTVLAWGLFMYKEGYETAGLLQDGREAVKWATDYFLKCHVNDNTFYGQVGKTDLDHDYWGRPEDMTMDRPAYKLDPDNPGSDLLGETAAALAAAYLVFVDVDEDYANDLLTHSFQLFDLANENRGTYTDSIPDAKESYRSSDYEDELAWAATWIFRATLNESYLQMAEEIYDSSKFQFENGFDWDMKNSGIDVLLYAFTDTPRYMHNFRTFCDDMLHTHKRTPKGLVYIDKRGTLGLSAAASLICLEAANLGINGEEYRKFAKQQIDYMLGDAGRSFVVGFGLNPPTHEHHASSSCPDAPEPCDWDNFNSDEPNSHILYGALVGGPDENDEYVDRRQNNTGNDVACVFNAGFQTVLAAMIQYDARQHRL